MITFKVDKFIPVLKSYHNILYGERHSNIRINLKAVLSISMIICGIKNSYLDMMTSIIIIQILA